MHLIVSSRFLVAALLVGILTASSARAQGKDASGDKAASAFFEKDVLPVLRANCLKCHGEGKIRGGLRLTSREAVLKGGEQGPAVSLEKPETSRLLQAIQYRDGLEMPPTGKLADKDLAVLTRWVKAGIPWSPNVVLGKAVAGAEPGRVTPEARAYWAYKPVRRPQEPAVKDAAWVRNPIDALLLARLEEKGLAPAVPAERVALLRRVTFDLTGLPPTPEETAAFLADRGPDAYEKLVDRLLASPHYGEKWGRHWLDIVGYAETNGYERDNPKPFAWRYRDYVIDAFNEDKPYDQFLREQLAGDLLDDASRSRWIATGYYRLGLWDDEPVDRRQARYDMLDTLVSTTSQVALGMTVGCVRCHDHKRDPIPQKDYYRLLAFFADVSDMNKDNTRFIATPEERLAHEHRLHEIKAEADALAHELQLQEQEFILARALQQPASALETVGGRGERTVIPDARKGTARWSYTFTRAAPGWNRVDFLETDWKQGSGAFGLPSSVGLTIRTPWETPDIWLRQKFELTEIPQVLAVELSHEEEVEVFINGKVAFRGHGFDPNYSRHPVPPDAHQALRIGANVLAIHCRQETNGQYVDAGLVAMRNAVSVADLIKRNGSRVWGADKTQRYLDASKRLQDLRKQSQAQPGLEVMCVEERGRAETHVLIRGNAALSGALVTCGVPEVLVPAEASTRPLSPEKKRLQLVDWLTQADNPLTARVMVNRLWQHHFGRGIVPTPNDFGKLGELPTNPELLDWLASEFVQGGWKIKRMHKLILLSNAYRMSARASPEGLRVDPGNTLLWHFPMRRLSAEEVRDTILAVSGELRAKAGGPCIYPPISPEVLAGQSRPGYGWPTSPPEEARRRSVYVHVKRSLQLPILAIHDQADTDSSCPVRYTTTVPTQALGMLNGEFTNEQAKALAARLRREAPDIKGQIRRVYLLTASRPPDETEIRKDLAFLQELETKGGLSPDDALRTYCLMHLNCNEFLYLD